MADEVVVTLLAGELRLLPPWSGTPAWGFRARGFLAGLDFGLDRPGCLAFPEVSSAITRSPEQKRFHSTPWPISNTMIRRDKNRAGQPLRQPCTSAPPGKDNSGLDGRACRCPG